MFSMQAVTNEESLEAFEEGRRAGVWAAHIVLLMIVLLGTIKCVQIARRPEASPYGPLALALALWGCFGSTFVMDATQFSPRLGVLLGVLAAGALLYAILLSLKALLDGRQRKMQGSKQAIAAFLLSTVAVAFFW